MQNYNLNNLNAKDVSRVSGFVANHPSIAKKGLQVAAYASGDKETAKKIGQTNTKDIADTASRINKGANFYMENQNTINEINGKMDKFNRSTNGTLPVNKFINSSAISNSTTNNAMPQYGSPTPSTVSSTKAGIAAPPPLPGRIHADTQVTRNNSMSAATRSTVNGVNVNRSNTVGSHSPVGNTTKFNKPPPPPTPNHQPDYIKMQETITNSNTVSSPKTIAAPPPLPNRPSMSKLKRIGSDSNVAGQGAGVASPGVNNSINRNPTHPISYGNQNRSPQSRQMKPMNNELDNEINRVFNITVPPDNISRYSNVFNQVAENNLITDSTVKALWVQSGIPKKELAKIWTFVNRKVDGLLEKTEFIVGMYLIDQYLNGYDIEYYFNSING